MHISPWGGAPWPHAGHCTLRAGGECSAPSLKPLYKLTLGQNKKCKEDPHDSTVEPTVLTTQMGPQEARSRRIQNQVLEITADAAKASVLTDRRPHQEYGLLKW